MPDDRRDATPSHVERENTERIVRNLLSASRDLGNATPRAASPAEEIVEAFIGRMNEKATGGRRVLGMTRGEIAKFSVALVAAVGGAYLGIQAAVQDNSAAIERHTAAPGHPVMIQAVDQVDGRVDAIERRTDRIETKQEAVLEGIGEIKTELRDQRRRRRRTDR